MRIFSWNINGLRAVLNKGALQDFLTKESPDILCLQEIKCKPEQCDFDFASLGYNIFWNPAERPGYSGTAILIQKRVSESIFMQFGSKSPKEILGDFPHFNNISRMKNPADLSAIKDFSSGEHVVQMTNAKICSCCEKIDSEGRCLILELPNFYLVDVYVPNSKPDLSRLELREKSWDPGLKNYLKELEKEKPVVICGDFNAAHEEIDIARPKTNHHSAGFTDEERKGITNLIKAGFIDTFRELNPTSIRYTWWSHWGKARENNVGWRIDYFFISQSLRKNLHSAEIYEDYLGSDHCPISVELEF